MTQVRPPATLSDRMPAVLRAQHGRLRARLEGLAPSLATKLLPWMEDRAAKGAPPEAYFTHPLAFPLMQLPWWLEESLGREADEDLQADLMYSSMCGYYLIRLMDDVMDRSEAAEARLLPAVAVLHAEFQATYGERFPAGSSFWRHFHEAWARCHAAAIDDASLTDIDHETFLRTSARKVSAATIPLMAVSLCRGLGGIPPRWADLFRELCAWHQLYNDLFDWKRDLDAGVCTWFLSEGTRRKRAGESMIAWVSHEGFELGVGWVEQGLARLLDLAARVGSPSLVAYFELRRVLLEESAGDARAGLSALRVLLAAGLPDESMGAAS